MSNYEEIQKDNNTVIIRPVGPKNKSNSNKKYNFFCFMSSDEDSFNNENINNHVTLEDYTVA